MSKKNKQRQISQDKNEAQVSAGSTDNVEAVEPDESKPKSGKAQSDIVWLASCGAITLLAFFLRFFWLGLKPFHHDEGVNGWFLANLFRDGAYRYDPANYHGPTLYYITLGFSRVFGMDTIPVRWSVAIWGLFIVILAFFLRRYIGRVGALTTAALLALSPGMVYISRYFIHEIFFIFLALTLVMAVAFFIENKKAGPFAMGWFAALFLACFYPLVINIVLLMSVRGTTSFYLIGGVFFLIMAAIAAAMVMMLSSWNQGRPVYIILATASVSLMFATKETAFITLGTMAIAIVCIWIWRKIYGSNAVLSSDDEINDAELNWRNFVAAFGTGADRWLTLAICAFTFIFIFVLLFTSYFSYPEGVKKAIEAYAIWTKTGTRDHANGTWAYLDWLWKIESPIVVLSAVGTAIAFAISKHRFAMFAGLWTLGLFIAYSIIPYKTPWLALSFTLPACIVGGYAINEIAKLYNNAGIPAAVLACAVSFGLLGYNTYDLNFVRYDDDKMPYVYAHTRRQFLDMIDKIEHYAKVSGKNDQTRIDVVSADYWPMVWYMKDHPKAIFHGRLIDDVTAEMIVAKKGEQDSEVIRRYSKNFRYAGSYALRPGVDLILLVRKDLAPNETKEINSTADLN